MFSVLGAVLLPAVPLLALLACLLLGRFPGERTIERIARGLSVAARRAPRLAASARRTSRPVSFAPRGGLLIGCGLARRPPPALP